MAKVGATQGYFLAGEDQRIEKSVTINSPANTPIHINLYIVLPGINKTVKKSVPAIQSGPDYTATFDLNNVLHSELIAYLEEKEQFAFPGDPDAPIVDRSDLMLQFYTDHSYTYMDANNEVAETDPTDNSEDVRHYALQGGLSRVMTAYLHSEGLEFDAWLKKDSNKWFSWMPDKLPVHAAQPVRLWFLNSSILDSLHLKTNVFFTDGTSVSDVDRAVVNKGEGLFEVACGPQELRLVTIDISKRVTKYQVWLENTDGSVKTMLRTFVIDQATYERNDLLFFRSSLGVHEVLWCNGRRKEQLDIDQDESIRPLTTPSLTKGTTRSGRGETKQDFDMNTGFYPKHLRHYLMDFVAAGEAVLPVGFFMLPVIIGKGKYPFGEDGEDLFSLAFKMKVAHTERHYSQLPDVPSPWGDFNSDFNEDFF